MADRFIPTDFSLVKYNNPVVVTVHDKKRWSTDYSQVIESRSSRAETPGFPQLPRIPGLSTLSNVNQDAGLGKKETEEILNTILPPKEWEDDGKLWRQMVSSVPSTRVDVINLQEHLDMRLKQRQAKETGICPVRHDLYSQCFDELIRQVTINCAERGLLLLRVRDEINMTLAAYQALYESATSYGIRKALLSEAGKADLEAKLADVSNQRNCLERKVDELNNNIEQQRRANEEFQESSQAKHEEEMKLMKRANHQLKQQLEALIGPTTKKPGT